MLVWTVIEGILKSKDIVMRRINADSLPGGQFSELKVDDDPNVVYVTGMYVTTKHYYELLNVKNGQLRDSLKRRKPMYFKSR